MYPALLAVTISLSSVTTSTAVHTATLERAAPGRDTTVDFHWTGAVAPHRWIRIRNVSGWIRVERASGQQAEITGHKSWRRGNPDDVRIVMEHSDAGDVVVCALWDDERHCDEGGEHHHWHGNDRDDDVSVDFTVALPAGVKIGANTVNGSVEVEGASDEVSASSVNGHVRAETSGGPVEASSVNGSVDATMGAVGTASRLAYKSVNGSVHVTLPADVKADVELSTMNGSVRSDFPIQVSGHFEPRRMHGTIGGGGLPVEIETVNGSIELRKASS